MTTKAKLEELEKRIAFLEAKFPKLVVTKDYWNRSPYDLSKRDK